MIDSTKKMIAFGFWTAALLGLVAFSACSLRYDFQECSTDVDCERLEGAGPFLRCEENTCVEATELSCRVDGDCSEGESCEAGACIGQTLDAGTDVGGDAEVSIDAGPGMDASEMVVETCSSGSECGVDELCIEGTCTSLLSEQCERAVFPSGIVVDPVVLGSILPLSPPYTNLGPPLEKAIELAVADFNNTGGLPGGRKVVWVSCNGRGNTDLAQVAARHLVEIGAPAIVGPLFSTSFIDVATNVTVRNGVFTIAPSATAPSITGLDDDGLAWRTIASDVYQGNAYVDRLEDLGPDSVTIFIKDDAYGLGLFNEIAGPLNSLYSEPAKTLEFIQYRDPAKFGFDENQITMEFATKVDQAYRANPDAEVVGFIGTSETLLLANAYLQYLGQNGVPPSNYPKMLFSHGTVPDLPDLVTASGGSLLPLVEGTAPDIFNPDNFAAYTLRFNLRFENQDPITVSPLAYDSTFVILFSMSAIPRGEVITGRKIADNIEKLVDKDNGMVVSFGDSTFVNDARNALSSGGTVDLVGVSGELDFNLETGDVRSNVLGWEVVDEGGGDYQLAPQRIYMLNPPPAQDGAWMTIPPM